MTHPNWLSQHLLSKIDTLSSQYQVRLLTTASDYAAYQALYDDAFTPWGFQLPDMAALVTPTNPVLIIVNRNNQMPIGGLQIRCFDENTPDGGFCHGALFKLDTLPREVLSRSFELNGLCIHPDHKNGRSFLLLFKAIKCFATVAGVESLLGGIRICVDNMRDAIAFCDSHYQAGYGHPDFQIAPNEHIADDDTVTLPVNPEDDKSDTLLTFYLRNNGKLLTPYPCREKPPLCYSAMILMPVANMLPRFSGHLTVGHP